jgi:hypothetical protein
MTFCIRPHEPTSRFDFDQKRWRMLNVARVGSAVPSRMAEIDLSQRFAGTGRSVMVEIDQYPERQRRVSNAGSADGSQIEPNGSTSRRGCGDPCDLARESLFHHHQGPGVRRQG